MSSLAACVALKSPGFGSRQSEPQPQRPAPRLGCPRPHRRSRPPFPPPSASAPCRQPCYPCLPTLCKLPSLLEDRTVMPKQGKMGCFLPPRFGSKTSLLKGLSQTPGQPPLPRPHRWILTWQWHLSQQVILSRQRLHTMHPKTYLGFIYGKLREDCGMISTPSPPPPSWIFANASMPLKWTWFSMGMGYQTTCSPHRPNASIVSTPPRSPKQTFLRNIHSSWFLPHSHLKTFPPCDP